ncbi:MAG: hypothetical protein AAF639_20810 [Chloroflexota bacterium]
MNIREIVLTQLASIVEESSPLPFPDPVPDDTLIGDFWLDSIAFTNLLAKIEEIVGFIPIEILKGATFPETIGELVEMYESEALERAS